MAEEVRVELGQTLLSPTQLYSDNVSAINMVETPIEHDKFKLVEIDGY